TTALHRTAHFREEAYRDMIRVISIAFLMCFAISECAFATLKDYVKKGNLLYNDKKYSEAAKIYSAALKEKRDSGVVNFNIGAAKYKEGSYSGSIDSFNKAIASGDAGLVPKADYNIGNVQYKIGTTKQKSDFNKTKELYETALKFYKRAIDLDPSDKDAKYNYEFVENRLMQLMEQKNQDKQQQDKQEQQKDQQKGSQPQDAGGGGSQEKEETGKQEEQQKEGKSSSEQDKGDQKDQDQKQGEDEKNAADNKKEGEESDQQKKEGGEQEENPKEQDGDKEEQQKQEGEKENKQQPGDQEKDKGGTGEEEQEQPKPSEEGKEEETAGISKEDEEGGGLTAYQSPQEQGEPGEMSEQEAKMILEGYKGEEATGGAIKMMKKRVNLPEPSRDW
ncbi:MAG: hypothetical protein PHT32_07025, partial [Candidatus Omnitrophica bacterium]|nr:hypothetical protein [Candidatus Omnitrophota bacterium]